MHSQMLLALTNSTVKSHKTLWQSSQTSSQAQWVSQASNFRQVAFFKPLKFSWLSLLVRPISNRKSKLSKETKKRLNLKIPKSLNYHRCKRKLSKRSHKRMQNVWFLGWKCLRTHFATSKPASCLLKSSLASVMKFSQRKKISFSTRRQRRNQ